MFTTQWRRTQPLRQRRVCEGWLLPYVRYTFTGPMPHAHGAFVFAAGVRRRLRRSRARVRVARRISGSACARGRGYPRGTQWPRRVSVEHAYQSSPRAPDIATGGTQGSAPPPPRTFTAPHRGGMGRPLPPRAHTPRPTGGRPTGVGPSPPPRLPPPGVPAGADRPQSGAERGRPRWALTAQSCWDRELTLLCPGRGRSSRRKQNQQSNSRRRHTNVTFKANQATSKDTSDQARHMCIVRPLFSALLSSRPTPSPPGLTRPRTSETHTADDATHTWPEGEESTAAHGAAPHTQPVTRQLAHHGTRGKSAPARRRLPVIATTHPRVVECPFTSCPSSHHPQPSTVPSERSMSQQASGTPARMARRSGGMYHVPAGRTAQRPPVHVAPHVRRHWLRTRALPHLFLDCLRRHFLSAIVSTHWRMTVFGENGGRAGAGGETGGEESAARPAATEASAARAQPAARAAARAAAGRFGTRRSRRTGSSAASSGWRRAANGSSSRYGTPACKWSWWWSQSSCT
jgi:hypothetical protein